MPLAVDRFTQFARDVGIVPTGQQLARARDVFERVKRTSRVIDAVVELIRILARNRAPRDSAADSTPPTPTRP